MPQSAAGSSPTHPGFTLRGLLPSRRALRILGGLTLAAGVAGISAGHFVRFDMPSVRRLEDYVPPEMTRILARDGREVRRLASEKRILLDHGEVPTSFRDALIASEDSRFPEHAGVDLVGVLRALTTDLRQGRFAQGASTLTMQLAGGLLLDRSERSVRRKLQELVLALAIERSYSKQEILRLYVNQVHFGHGLYGLEAASRHYFGKPARALTIGESAMLVGLLPRPASYSPFRDLSRATRRRDLVLSRMVQEGYLSLEQQARIAAEPIRLTTREPAGDVAPYFQEEVRRQLAERYGGAELYGGGMVVTTTLDRRLQRIASEAVDRGLRELDKRQGFRPAAVRRVAAGHDPQTWDSPAWSQGVSPGDVTDGIVVSIDPRRAEIRVAERRGSLDPESIAWTGETRPDRLLRVGDVIRVRVLEQDAGHGSVLALEQTPAVEAALIAIDPTSGEVLAQVGGFDFSRSPYDRAIRARRQTGSLFKSFVYAAALARGATLADTLLDEPTVFLDGRHPVPYRPENFERDYHGTITLRSALEASANIATVRLLERVGYDPVLETARALGVQSGLLPYPSLALGAFEMTLLEVTSAHGAFANQGLHFAPHWIREVAGPGGQTLLRAEPRVTEAISPQVAYLMNRALSGVVQHGTGRTAGAALGRTLAGKTGTTDDSADAWFVGYSPRLCVGVWVGYDTPRSLGRHETGARAALPIWIEFMERALAGTADEPFPVPPGITTAVIDPRTGMRPTIEEDRRNLIVEAFLEGTEPLGTCSTALHEQMRLPYPFQRFPLDADGSLAIPLDELEALLAQERGVSFDAGARVLEATTPDGVVRIGVRALPPGDRATRDRLDAEFDTSAWVGTDGRRASVVWFTPRDRRARARLTAGR